jgi:hypothetical protein
MTRPLHSPEEERISGRSGRPGDLPMAPAHLQHATAVLPGAEVRGAAGIRHSPSGATPRRAGRPRALASAVPSPIDEIERGSRAIVVLPREPSL